MAASRLTVSVDERTRRAKARLGELVLGKWRLTRLLGIGGMAAVFEAVHQSGSRVAIKFLHDDLAGSEDLRERFLAEGYAANRVAHPGVVTVRDEGTTADGAVFLVMDLLRGRTLAERLEEGKELFSIREALEIASQLLDVLVCAHGRGIVHRDIKPENVFLMNDGRVRLLDFGIARVDTARRSTAVEAGSTFGTPAFMAPEQALGGSEELDGRSDLWALGATLFLLLSGVPVREPGSDTEQLLSAMTRPAPSLGEVAALPRSVIAVVDRALAFDREDRFPDARSMQLAVRAVLDELSAPDSRITLPPPTLEPVALSLHAPRAEGQSKRASLSSVRPVAATSTPLPGSAKDRPSALPLFISLGFAVGIGIVVLARLSVNPSQRAAAEPERGVLAASAHGPARVASVGAATKVPAARAPGAAVTSSASARARPARVAPGTERPGRRN